MVHEGKIVWEGSLWGSAEDGVGEAGNCIEESSSVVEHELRLVALVHPDASSYTDASLTIDKKRGQDAFFVDNYTALNESETFLKEPVYRTAIRHLLSKASRRIKAPIIYSDNSILSQKVMIATISKGIFPTDPTFYFDLPSNYDQVFVRYLSNTNQELFSVPNGMINLSDLGPYTIPQICINFKNLLNLFCNSKEILKEFVNREDNLSVIEVYVTRKPQ